MGNFELYHRWYAFLVQLSPDGCLSRVTNWALLIMGLYQARQVYASAIVRQWSSRAKQTSLTRRLSRFLANPAIRVREWYAPIARQWLQAYTGREVHVIVDGSKVGFEHQLLMVALAYRRRAIPLAWTWVPYKRGHSSSQRQLALLAYVRRLVPPKTKVLLVGDAEFGSIDVLRQLTAWRWFYVLRQRGSTHVKAWGSRDWVDFETLVAYPSRQKVWWANARLTEVWGYRTHLFAYWQPGEKEPWLLATNLPSAQATCQAYARRMWIEEMFGDLKGHGVDLEATHLRHFLRLSRLTLAACLLYVWLIRFGVQTIKAGLRDWVDRHDRRDLSVFRIGWDMVAKKLALHVNFTVDLFT
jgi:hypothetical protein